MVLAVLASCLKLRHATTVGVAPPPLAANDFSLVCFFFVCFLLACRGWWKALPHDVEFCFLTFPHSTAQLGTKKEKKTVVVVVGSLLACQVGLLVAIVCLQAPIPLTPGFVVVGHIVFFMNNHQHSTEQMGRDFVGWCSFSFPFLVFFVHAMRLGHAFAVIGFVPTTCNKTARKKSKPRFGSSAAEMHQTCSLYS